MAIMATIWNLLITGGFGGIVAASVYWLLQRFIESRFSKRLEDYRHSYTAKLQNEDIRLSLYNRRFEIFVSIFDFYEAMISWEGTPIQKAARTRFFRAYQESGFLFSKESGIEELLKKLNDDGGKVIAFKEHPEIFNSDKELAARHFEESIDIQTRVFSDGLARLRVAFSSYLNFHHLER